MIFTTKKPVAISNNGKRLGGFTNKKCWEFIFYLGEVNLRCFIGYGCIIKVKYEFFMNFLCYFYENNFFYIFTSVYSSYFLNKLTTYEHVGWIFF